MWSARASCFLLAFGVVCGSVARADSALALLPQGAGERVHYRVTRSVATSDAPATATFDFDVQRKSPTTLTLEHRDAAGTPDISVLNVQRDGSVQLAASERAVPSEADVRDLVQFLDLALAAVNAGNGETSGWQATLGIPAARGTTQVVVPLRATHVSGPDFDIEGTGESAAGGSSGPSSRPARGGGAFPGGVPGGGAYPGGGFPNGGASGRARGGGQPQGGGSAGGGSAGGGGGVTLDLRVNGHVNGSRVTQLALVETRAVTVDGMPFTNVSSWTLSVVR